MSDPQLNRLDDDVEGHDSKWRADAEAPEGDDDVEGHGKKPAGR